MSKAKVEKYIKSLSSFDLWILFEYDELTINMRQQNDDIYKNILTNIRIRNIKDDNNIILQSRCIPFASLSILGRLKEVCDYLSNLPTDALCILPTNEMCDCLNRSMLDRIDSEEIELVAIDNVISCNPNLKKSAIKKLNNYDEDIARTAGLAKILVIKIGAKAILRRNIDTSQGLVNGAICKIESVTRGLQNDIERIKIILNEKVHVIERVTVSFDLFEGVKISRKQFPLILSYAITIHKS